MAKKKQKKELKKIEKELKKEIKKEKEMNTLAIVLGVIAVLFIILFIVSVSTNGFSRTMTKEEAAQRATDYINGVILSPQGLTASISNIKEENGVYVVSLNVNGQVADITVTKDGKLLFLGRPIVLPEKVSSNEGNSDQGFEKTDKPNVKLFVMSFCPFGNQAEQGLAPVYNLLGDKVDWEMHYVIYPSAMYSGKEEQFCIGDYCSMHGINELRQDVRELCVLKEYGKDKYWDFVIDIDKQCSLDNIEDCWKTVAQENGIDVNEINDCLDTEAETLLEEEYNLNQQYKVRGSPTMFINDKSYNGGRSPEAYKTAICSAFTTQPEECNTDLGGTTNTANGQC